MSGANLIIGQGGGTGPIPIEGLNAEAVLALTEGDEQQRANIIQTYSGILLNVIDRCLKEGVAVDPDLIDSLVSFESAVHLGSRQSEEGSKLHQFALVLSPASDLLESLRELSDLLEGDIQLTYNTYLRTGYQSASLYNQVFRLTDLPPPEGLSIPFRIDQSSISALSSLMKKFSENAKPKTLWELTKDVKRGLLLLDTSVTKTLECTESNSVKYERLKKLKPFVLIGIQALRLMHEFPPSATELKPTDVDYSNWRDVRKIVRRVADLMGPALAA